MNRTIRSVFLKGILLLQLSLPAFAQGAGFPDFERLRPLESGKDVQVSRRAGGGVVEYEILMTDEKLLRPREGEPSRNGWLAGVILHVYDKNREKLLIRTPIALGVNYERGINPLGPCVRFSFLIAQEWEASTALEFHPYMQIETRSPAYFVGLPVPKGNDGK